MVEFKIYKDGRWRSVWRALDGWRGARWVSRRGGALREEGAARVAGALRALAAGAPSCVRVGAPLPGRWPHTEPSRKKKRHRSHCIRFKRYEEVTNVKRTQRDASVQTDSQLRLHRLANVLQPNSGDADRRNKRTNTHISTDDNVLTKRALLDNRRLFKKPGSPSKYVRRPASSTEQQVTDENVPTKRRQLSLNREQTKRLQTPVASPNTNKRRDSDNDTNKMTKDFPTRHAQLYNVKKNLAKKLHVSSPTKKVRERDSSSDSDKNANDNVRIKLGNKMACELVNPIKSPTKTVRVRGSSSASDKSKNDNAPKKSAEHNNKKTNKLRKPTVSPKKPIRQIDSSTDSESTDEPSKRTQLNSVKSQRLQKLTTSPSKKVKALSVDADSSEDDVFKKTKNSKPSPKTTAFLNKKVRQRDSSSDSDQATGDRITKRQTHSISDVHKQTSKHVSSPMKRTNKEINRKDPDESQDENEPMKTKTDGDYYKRIKSMKRKNSLEISSDSEQENILLKKRKECLKRKVLEALGPDSNLQKKSVHNRHRILDGGIASYLQKQSPIKHNHAIVKIDITDSDSEKNRQDKKKRNTQVTSSDSDPSQVIFEGRRLRNNESLEDYKELIIDEEDVTLLRNFIEKHCAYIDLYKFDCDDGYKQQIFYRINPVVRLERCARIVGMLRERETREFAGQLGLRSVTSSDNEVGKRRSLRTERRVQDSKKTVQKDGNIEKNVQKDKDRTSGKTVRSDKEGASKAGEKKTSRMAPMKAPKRSCVRPGREYTPLEDHSIVAWVSGGGEGRARCVNGNRVWRQLQASYTAITGQVRTWHSLRNRYLRYILPALGALALPPRQAARLRAAAAAGEIKSGKQQRRASILAERPVLSASARRPRPPAAPPSPGAPGGGGEAVRRSPRVAAAVKSAPSAESAPERGAPAPAPGAPSPQRPRRAGRSPRYSEVTRRFASAHTHTDTDTSRTDGDEPDKDRAQEQRTRSRRLYNPTGAV